MAATIAVASPQHQAVAIGGLRARMVKVTPDTSYPTAGYAITPASVGLNEIFAVIVLGLDITAVTTSAIWQFNVQTGKLQAFGTAGSATGLTEIANGQNLSVVPVRLLILGV